MYFLIFETSIFDMILLYSIIWTTSPRKTTPKNKHPHKNTAGPCTREETTVQTQGTHAYSTKTQGSDRPKKLPGVRPKKKILPLPHRDHRNNGTQKNVRDSPWTEHLAPKPKKIARDPPYPGNFENHRPVPHPTHHRPRWGQWARNLRLQQEKKWSERSKEMARGSP